MSKRRQAQFRINCWCFCLDFFYFGRLPQLVSPAFSTTNYDAVNLDACSGQSQLGTQHRAWTTSRRRVLFSLSTSIVSGIMLGSRLPSPDCAPAWFGSSKDAQHCHSKPGLWKCGVSRGRDTSWRHPWTRPRGRHRETQNRYYNVPLVDEHWGGRY